MKHKIRIITSCPILTQSKCNTPKCVNFLNISNKIIQNNQTVSVKIPRRGIFKEMWTTFKKQKHLQKQLNT